MKHIIDIIMENPGIPSDWNMDIRTVEKDALGFEVTNSRNEKVWVFVNKGIHSFRVETTIEAREYGQMIELVPENALVNVIKMMVECSLNERTSKNLQHFWWDREFTENMKEDFDDVFAYLMNDCVPIPGNYAHLSKGAIITDVDSGVWIKRAKEFLHIYQLRDAKKYNEIHIDSSWPLDDHYQIRERLWAEASKVETGLLVVNIEDIKMFNDCWSIKQLAKQEIGDLRFKGFVLVVVNGIPWNDCENYAKVNNLGQYEAMMSFYRRNWCF